MHIWFWFWVLAAAVLLIAELLTRELLYAPFTAGAVAAGLMEWSGLPTDRQWLAFLGLSLALSVLLRRRILALRGWKAGGGGGDSEPSEPVGGLAENPLAHDDPSSDDATPGPDYRNVPRRSRRLHRRGR